MAYPVSVSVEPLYANRNRLTTLFRLILYIPHALLVGGIGFGFAYGQRHVGVTSFGGESGVLGAVAIVLAIVSWFSIVLAGNHLGGIRQYTRFYLYWRVRALSYLMLLEDNYPPFGGESYPASVAIVDPAGARDRLTVALRLLLIIPHPIALGFVMFGWWGTGVGAGVALLVGGAYPQGLYHFGVGALRWLMRVEA